MVAADKHLIAGEGEIRVAEVEQSASPWVPLFVFRSLRFPRTRTLCCISRLRAAGLRRPRAGRRASLRAVGIVETLRLRAGRHDRHVPDGLAGVIEAGCEVDPRIDRQLREHGVHPIDLHALVGLYVGREREELRVLCRAALIEKVLDHRQGAAVVLDHELEEEPVERYPFGRGELVHLFRGEHARHRHPAGRMVRIRRGHRLSALAQPLLHHADLVLLGELDPLRHLPHGIARGARLK